MKQAGDIGCTRSKFARRLWWNMMQEEHSTLPCDYVAEVRQSVIMLHSEELLASSGRGIAKLCRLLRRQMHAVAEGAGPAGVGCDLDATPILFEAGSHLRDK